VRVVAVVLAVDVLRLVAQVEQAQAQVIMAAAVGAVVVVFQIAAVVVVEDKAQSLLLTLPDRLLALLLFQQLQQ
jgi:hypothetical protein